ncbi:polysaccharide biosynthesis protein [Polaribacter irgensii 23-P]|uniref:Polysaccharide biosynthesis protein n=1 Tax=Polaribacter irgensii 23-P TaxID=313594 RepID=A4BY11_9FLAO|nr:3'-5' exonuclease [Polaribacter irgensii]EAR13852.1 polysaccharide biosynthesis protein [Polaribacter irgensii 23-P]
MNLSVNLKDVLFLDIETVPQKEKWQQLSKETQALYEKKTRYQRKEEFTAEAFYGRAGIWAEFGKIVCISVGYFITSLERKQFRLTSFYGDDEHAILTDFKALLVSHFAEKSKLLCAHNGKEFDFPFIARRMIVHQIALPEKLNLFGKKPWEVKHLDTLELWKFGDYKQYTSLKLLTSILGIPSPKEDIDGSEVAEVYYREKNMDRIVDYCEKDTLAVAQVLLRFNNQDLLKDSAILRA